MGLPDDDALRRAGIRILKMGMLFPMEPTVVRDFAQGLEEIFVIEEKRPFLEMFAKETCCTARPTRRASSASSTRRRRSCCRARRVRVRRHRPRAPAPPVAQDALESAEAWLRASRRDPRRAASCRPPRAPAWYCSGCPHNCVDQRRSTGSVVSAGIGCHTMAMWMDRNVVMGTHMGAEGAQWIGMAPFTDMPHIFQNIGDGTYAHSGSLAIRYCAATDTNITFKMLRNTHTSMTGGQEIHGRPNRRRSSSRDSSRTASRRSSSPPTISTATTTSRCPSRHRGLAPRPPGRGAGRAGQRPRARPC